MKFNGQFDTIQEAVADTLNSKIPGAFNGFVPVVVSTIYTRNRANVGIQFWKPEWIFSGATRLNTDGTISKFIQQA